MNDSVDRIKTLINELKITKNKFMKSLGYSHVALINWENGKNIGDKTLRLIEQTYNVNPSWLREGIGEMFLTGNKETVDLDHFSREQIFVISALKNMGANEVNDLLKYIEEQEIIKEYKLKYKKEKAG